MTFKQYIIAGLLSLIFEAASSQIKLPIFDVELKIHQNLMPGDGEVTGDVEFVETTNFYTGAHVQLNQYVALGAFYSRSFRGITQIRFNDDNVKYSALSLQKGLDVRLSTGRAKNWRQYLVIQYSTVEILQDNEAYRLADKSNTFGISLGIMRRLSNNLYLNVIELGVCFLTDNIFWFGDSNGDGFITAKMGLTYNIGKRK